MKRKEYIDKILEIYSLVSVLSQKNNCEVLRLRNKKSGKDLVLRSFPDQLKAYENLQQIRCVNLPEIYDVFEMDDGQIVLEEYINGITVAQVMEVDQYRSSGAREVLFGVCDALTTLHNRGIIHRDVKPGNVMVEQSARRLPVESTMRSVGEHFI